MRASQLADLRYIGPVRLLHGAETFRAVAWTRPKKADADSKLVRLSRTDGVIGDCRVSCRYVAPQRELVPLQITNFRLYQTAALATAIYPKDKALEYTTLGLCAEVGELAAKLVAVKFGEKINAAELLAELGDVFWYLATVADTFGLWLDALPAQMSVELSVEPFQAVLRLCGASGEIANRAKKIIRDGLAIEAVREQIAAQLHLALSVGCALSSMMDASVWDVLTANIGKLHSRRARGVLRGSGDNR